MASNFIENNSDTLSEVSESTSSGWTTRWDSREDLKDLVSRLGLSDISQLHQERFRVDRGKLEKMLTGANEALFPADVFFAQVMENTDTIITWPNKLKIGAKSKKDPHVRIAGKHKDVQIAKDRILTAINPTTNRVTMKMDVSYTDHSHIIGKAGLSIKRVMEETRCHVHFPDSNRSNSTEKSNQVSISGNITGVEFARSRVRELIPLIFGFELPVMSQNVDPKSTQITKIQEQYKVQVMFKTRPKLHATLVLVKGVEWEVHQVKQATQVLMESMCDSFANQIPVQMSMEISPHHHAIVLGKNHSNLKDIMSYTKCQIMFSDAQDPNISNLKKSNVTITGTINNVYIARQLLMGSLPLIVIFDLPEDTDRLKIKHEQLIEIQNYCDVSINIRQKANKTTKACVIKGIEKHAGNIYKARNVILGLTDTPVEADIPISYFIACNVVSPLDESTKSEHSLAIDKGNITNIYPPPPLSSPLVSTTWYPSPTITHASPSFLVNHTQHQFFPTNMSGNGLNNGFQTAMRSENIDLTDKSNQTHSSCSSSSLSSNSGNATTLKSSARQSLSYLNIARENHYDKSPTSERMNNPGEYHGTTISKRSASVSTIPADYSTNEYDNRNQRLNAYKAMQMKVNPGNLRVPNNAWSGYGVSHTSSGGFFMGKSSPRDVEEKIWRPFHRPNNDSSSSNVCLNTSDLSDYVPDFLKNRMSISNNWNDLTSLLISMKLDHYIGLFKQHEIDLTVFATLTEQDLLYIGISAFGARRRIMLAITELNKRAAPFSAAPGAERNNNSQQKTSIW